MRKNTVSELAEKHEATSSFSVFMLNLANVKRTLTMSAETETSSEPSQLLSVNKPPRREKAPRPGRYSTNEEEGASEAALTENVNRLKVAVHQQEIITTATGPKQSKSNIVQKREK